MPCLILLVTIAFPRIAIMALFFLTNFLERAYHSLLILVLGFLFLPARWQIRVLDASAQGLKLRVPEFLHPGTAVQIRLEHTIALAEVRYCLTSGAEFHVGVQLQDIFPRNRHAVEI